MSNRVDNKYVRQMRFELPDDNGRVDDSDRDDGGVGKGERLRKSGG